MNVLLALALVAGLFGLGMAGAASGLPWVVGVVLPYVAVGVFVVGLTYQVLRWAGIPVPFRIPTTCGQQRSLDWIRHQPLENPAGLRGVLGRMALEILCFRSLLRNTRTIFVDGRRLTYATDLSLWLGAIVFHWSLLIVLVRHLRLMTSPVPGFVAFVEGADGFFEIGMPVLYVSTILLLLALAYLLYRRLAIPNVRYISLAGDYFALFLLLGIAGSGAWMRHLAPTDIASVKALVLGLTHFRPTVPATISPLFYGHLFLVCVLLRHVNPWDYPVAVHTYDEYEDELREKMIGAGLPVERH